MREVATNGFEPEMGLLLEGTRCAVILTWDCLTCAACCLFRRSVVVSPTMTHDVAMQSEKSVMSAEKNANESVNMSTCRTCSLLKNNDNRTIANQHVPCLELGGDVAVGRCLCRSRSRGTCSSGIIAGIAHQHVPRLELGGSAAVGRCLRRSVRQTCRSGKSISIGGTIAHDKQNQV